MKEITEANALYKLAAMCSTAEHCSFEMLQKMQKWKIAEEAQTRIMEQLINDKYVDDHRYCQFFINDKLKYNHWGRMKIEQALWEKHIPKDISDPIFDEIPDENYLKVLRPLIANKRKNTKAESEYELNGKLIKYAMGRGFSMQLIRQCMNTDEYNIEEENEKFFD